MDSLNRSLFLAMNASAGASGPVVWLAVFAAKYLIFLVPAHLVLVWVVGNRRMRFIALTALAALVIGIVLNSLIGFAVYSPRPFVIGLGTTLIEHRANSSMPSNHATVLFTYAFVLFLFQRTGLAVATLVIALLVAWSRIYLGIHYPLDMLVGAATAAVAAFSATALASRYGEPVLRLAEQVWERVLGLVGRRGPPAGTRRR